MRDALPVGGANRLHATNIVKPSVACTMRPRSGLADNREVVGADLPLDRNGLAVGARTYGKTDEKRGPPSC